MLLRHMDTWRKEVEVTQNVEGWQDGFPNTVSQFSCPSAHSYGYVCVYDNILIQSFVLRIGKIPAKRGDKVSSVGQGDDMKGVIGQQNYSVRCLEAFKYLVYMILYACVCS